MGAAALSKAVRRASLGLRGLLPRLGEPTTLASPSSIPSLGDGAMLGTAWIDRPVDTQDLHSLLPRPL
jgi:hypothetical protein